ncbi:MAG: LD-carboxypeptidase [Ignavibacterium sp.]|nr:MAG: LD-carboxypeptidase [Ignavibacterium sp.]
MRLIKPERLKKGDVIGVISPASSPLDPTKLDSGVKYLEKLGYRVEIGKNVGKVNGYLAGSDEERADDLNSMFRNKDIKAIMCLRGGYGAFRILDKINYKLIRSNPKIFIGFSEITAIQTAILHKAGLITFAGPMVASDFANSVSSYTEELFWRLLTSNKKLGRLRYPDQTKLSGITKGSATGRILGGNLAVFNALIGSPYFPLLKDRILLLEDVAELPYKIDRMFNQLKMMKVFNKVKGIVLGRFVDCYEHDPMKKTLTLGEVMEDYLNGLKIPVVYTFPHGHIKDKVTVPIGINIKMNATKGFIEYNESAVK